MMKAPVSYLLSLISFAIRSFAMFFLFTFFLWFGRFIVRRWWLGKLGLVLARYPFWMGPKERSW